MQTRAKRRNYRAPNPQLLNKKQARVSEKADPPYGFDLECTTVWSFPERGRWATHEAGFRGNWAPQVARNLILRYSNQGDLVLDPMVGGGTTLIECAILGRRGIGLDINPKFVEACGKSLKSLKQETGIPNVTVKVGDARNLSEFESDSVDLVATHPPYADIIKYSQGRIEGDLSNHHSIEVFCEELEKVGKELFRVLKPGKYCALLIGDTRRRQMYIPIALTVMQTFLNLGFRLREDIVKVQHNCKMTPYWQYMSKKFNFLLIMHEHLFVFKKP